MYLPFPLGRCQRRHGRHPRRTASHTTRLGSVRRKGSAESSFSSETVFAASRQITLFEKGAETGRAGQAAGTPTLSAAPSSNSVPTTKRQPPATKMTEGQDAPHHKHMATPRTSLCNTTSGHTLASVSNWLQSTQENSSPRNDHSSTGLGTLLAHPKGDHDQRQPSQPCLTLGHACKHTKPASKHPAPGKFISSQQCRRSLFDRFSTCSRTPEKATTINDSPRDRVSPRGGTLASEPNQHKAIDQKNFVACARSDSARSPSAHTLKHTHNAPSESTHTCSGFVGPRGSRPADCRP